MLNRRIIFENQYSEDVAVAEFDKLGIDYDFDDGDRMMVSNDGIAQLENLEVLKGIEYSVVI